MERISSVLALKWKAQNQAQAANSEWNQAARKAN
jgi:hypothetical protein